MPNQMSFKNEKEHLEFLIQRLLFMTHFGSNYEGYKSIRTKLINIKENLEEVE